jgi:hypothetical protein
MHDLWDIIMLLIRAISWLIRTKVASYIYIYIYIYMIMGASISLATSRILTNLLTFCFRFLI